jgi:hypothetical protein
MIEQFPEDTMVVRDVMLHSLIDKHLCFGGNLLPPPSSYPGEGSLPCSQEPTIGHYPEP